MSRSAFLASGCFIALVVLKGPAAGQTAVEAGLGAAGSSTAAAAARNLSGSINGALLNLDNAVRSAGIVSPSKPHSPATSGAAKSAPAKHAIQRKQAGKAAPQPESAAPAILPPPQRYEDAAGIEKGIEYQELVGRFGPPSMEIASGDGAKTMSYVSNSGAVQVEFRDGKVTSVEKPKS
jgi:hypothetical protein